MIKSKHKRQKKMYSIKVIFIEIIFVCFYHYNSVTGTVDCCRADDDVDDESFRVGSVL